LPDLNLREYCTLMPLVLLAFWIGLYPKPIFRYLDKPVQQIVQAVNPDYYKSAGGAAAARAAATPAHDTPASIAPAAGR
jgi:NADH-quinone oxidoreductase subunit M